MKLLLNQMLERFHSPWKIWSSTMRKLVPYRRPALGIAARLWPVAIVFSFCLHAAGAEARGPDDPLRVAVYDVAPYGSVDAQGLFSGASVDLWRRVAEELHVDYRLTAVSQMDAVLTGLENGQFDAAIGAITITPERLARVDFSYPAHRSGVAVAFQRKTGPVASVTYYGEAVRQHFPLIAVTLVLLLLTGALMWRFERRRMAAAQSGDSSVTTLFDGFYWAVVTMTTVGYGDKTPKTRVGRFIAVLWMLTSLALISLVSTTLVSSTTAARLESGPLARDSDLTGKRLAAVASSSGAEYLDSQHLPYTKYSNLQDALASLASGTSDAVVNSVGALQYMIATQFYGVIPMPSGILAPAYMAFALPPNSPLKKPLDRAMVKVTASSGWRSLEDSYFDR
jgi:polar amino acid transport system substrate-binding protein